MPPPPPPATSTEYFVRYEK